MWLLVLGATILLEQWLRGWKWRQILFDLKPISRARLLGAILAGYGVAILVPLGISPLVRSWLIARLEGLRMATVLVTTVNIPPCDSCHSANALAIYPRLGGLSQTYLKNQLRLWKTGLRRETATERLMDVIASRLSDEQIAAVSAYYASLKVTGQAAR
jgi:cytochrome c553